MKELREQLAKWSAHWSDLADSAILGDAPAHAAAFARAASLTGIAATAVQAALDAVDRDLDTSGGDTWIVLARGGDGPTPIGPFPSNDKAAMYGERAGDADGLEYEVVGIDRPDPRYEADS